MTLISFPRQAKLALFGAVFAACWLAVSSGMSRAEEPPGATLESLLAHARQHNPEVAAVGFDASAATERIAPAGALPDPTLRMELQNVTNIGSDAKPNLLPGRIGGTKYTVIQPLVLWGKRDLKTAQAQAEADQAKGRQSAAWSDLAARIRSAYAQFYLAHRLVSLTQENFDLASGIADIAQARYAAGRVAQQDAIRARVELTAMKAELLSLKNERHHLHVQLNALLGRTPEAPLATPMLLPPLPAEARLISAELHSRLDSSPLLQVEDAGVTAAENNRELAYRNRYPDVAVGISPTQTGNRIGMWEAMVELNIPLQQESRRSREREAEAGLRAAQSRRENLKLKLAADLDSMLAELALNRELAQLAHGSLLPQAQANFEAALAGYEGGRVDFATLLDAQRQIRRARQDELKAQAAAQARLADIERLLGAAP